MPLFHNPTDNPLTFEISDQEYRVPAQGQVEIADRFAYLVKARGMVLRPGPHPTAGERAPSAEVREAIPADVEQLLHSPRLPVAARDRFRAAWREASRRERVELQRELALRAEGRGVGKDEDPDDAAPTPTSPAPTDDASASVESQLDDAVTKIGRGRKKSDN